MRHYKTCRECPLTCAVRRYRGVGDDKDCPPIMRVSSDGFGGQDNEIAAATPKEAVLLWAIDEDERNELELSYTVTSRKFYGGDPIQVAVLEPNGKETKFSLLLSPTFYVEPPLKGPTKAPWKNRKSPELAAHGLMVAAEANHCLNRDSIQNILLPSQPCAGLPPMPRGKVHMEWGNGPLCFCKGRVLLTDDESKVTCRRCQHSIGISDATRPG